MLFCPSFPASRQNWPITVKSSHYLPLFDAQCPDDRMLKHRGELLPPIYFPCPKTVTEQGCPPLREERKKTHLFNVKIFGVLCKHLHESHPLQKANRPTSFGSVFLSKGICHLFVEVNAFCCVVSSSEACPGSSLTPVLFLKYSL